jgi:hypothetical protein
MACSWQHRRPGLFLHGVKLSASLLTFSSLLLGHLESDCDSIPQNELIVR